MHNKFTDTINHIHLYTWMSSIVIIIVILLFVITLDIFFKVKFHLRKIQSWIVFAYSLVGIILCSILEYLWDVVSIARVLHDVEISHMCIAFTQTIKDLPRWSTIIHSDPFVTAEWDHGELICVISSHFSAVTFT